MVESSLLVACNPMTSISRNKTTWQTIQLAGIQKIERVVAEFYVECGYIPSRYFRVKVTQDAKGNYIGRLNISVKNSVNNTPEWITGLGDSVDAALEDAIQQFMQQLNHCGKDKLNLAEADFDWATCEDF